MIANTIQINRFITQKFFKIEGNCFSKQKNFQYYLITDKKIIFCIYIQPNLMQFRLRPSSKKSVQESDRSYDLLTRPNLQNDSLSIRTISNRMQQVESSIINLQQNQRRQRQISHASTIQIQKRLDMLEYKSFSNQKDLKHALDVKAIQQYASTPKQTTISKNEFQILREAFKQQRQSHNQYIKHQNSIFQEMNLKQMKIQVEMRQLFNRQKNQYDLILRSQSQQQKSLQSAKQQQNSKQYDMLKGIIEMAQRKIYEQLQRKIRNQTIIKDYIQDKISQLRNQIAAQQKTVLTSETKFIREAKQSMQTLFTIIQNTKNQLAQQLTETQKLSTVNIKRVSMSLDLIKQNLGQQLASIQQSQANIQSELLEFKNFMMNKLEENRQMILQLEQNQFDKGDSQGANGELGSSSAALIQDKIHMMQKDMNQWKSITQQKNLNVFKQISNTLKSLRIQWKKQNDQITSQLFSLKQSVTSIKKSVPGQIKKSVQTIITVFNSQFDVLAEQIDLLSEMIALGKKQSEKSFKEQLKKLSLQMNSQFRAIVDQKSKQIHTQLQKAIYKSEQHNKISLDKQSKYLVDLLTQKNVNLQNELNKLQSTTKKQQLNTNSQLEDFTMKLKTFNENYKDYLQEQRKDDMKKRMDLQEAMRKNASNLMDVSYKKSEFLVDGMKKAMQMNQMKEKMEINQKIDLLKDQNEKHLILTKNQLNQQSRKITEEINQLKKQNDQNFKKAKGEMQIQLKQMLDTVNKLKESNSKDIRQIENQLQQKVAQISDLVNTIKQNNQKDIGKIEEQLQSKIQKVQDEVTTVKQQNLLNLQETKTSFTQQLEQMQKRFKTDKDASQQTLHQAFQQSLNNVKRSLTIEINNMKLELQEKISQLKAQDSEQTQESINSIRQAVWKLEASLFSQQAKNKAVLDRLNQDIGDLASNVQILTKQIKIN